MDVFNLSKSSFTLIRNLLEGRVNGGTEAAKELAEAMHNLPEEGNNLLVKLTTKNLGEFVLKYPHLKKYISIDTIKQKVSLISNRSDQPSYVILDSLRHNM